MSALIAAGAIVLAAPTGVEPPPGDLGLLADPIPAASRADVPPPPPPPPVVPAPPYRSVAMAAVLVIAAVSGVRRIPRPGDTIAPPAPLVVVVPGFDSPATGTFNGLMSAAGVDPGAVREFDWRLVTGGDDHRESSRTARIDEAVPVLERFLASLGGSNPLYVVGHSKGAALVAEMTSRWDDDPSGSVGAVRGAMLLDPPIARGVLGNLQRAGGLFGLPNNGGYDPIDCGWFRCHDDRVGLGKQAGVDVVVIRNTDALVTSFHDEPRDLRVLDLDDDGGDPAAYRIWSDGSVVDRIVTAHHSPLSHPAVAACLAEELTGSEPCEWEAGAEHHGPPAIRGG